MLTFSNPNYTANITLSDFTGLNIPVKYNLTATTAILADAQAREIATRLSQVTAHHIKAVRINCTYENVDDVEATGSREIVGYLVGHTDTVEQTMFQLEVPGYAGPATGNEIDLLNTLVNDYAVLFEADGLAYVFGVIPALEFCRGWILDREKKPG